MIVFYDPVHKVHDPEREYSSDCATTPYPACGDRANVLAFLRTLSDSPQPLPSE